MLEDLKAKGYSAKVVKTQKTVLNQIFNYGIVEMKIQNLHNPVNQLPFQKIFLQPKEVFLLIKRLKP
ncbi:MAG: hypothetical protein RSD17_01500 [Oscillospiraceae bacterium]